jgi:hypothetical protein
MSVIGLQQEMEISMSSMVLVKQTIRRTVRASVWVAVFLTAILVPGRVGGQTPAGQPKMLPFPALVTEPVPARTRPIRLSEPTPRVWLPLAGEIQVRSFPPRAAPLVRPLPEPLALVWSPPEPMPARDAIPVGPKARASVTDVNVPPVPPLLTASALPASGPSAADTLFADYIRRSIVYWPEQPTGQELPAIPDPEAEMRQVRLRESLPEAPWLPPGLLQLLRPALPAPPGR